MSQTLSGWLKAIGQPSGKSVGSTGKSTPSGNQSKYSNLEFGTKFGSPDHPIRSVSSSQYERITRGPSAMTHLGKKIYIYIYTSWKLWISDPSGPMAFSQPDYVCQSCWSWL